MWIAAGLVITHSVICAADVTEQELEEAKARNRQEILSTEAEIADLTKQKTAAAKADDRDVVKQKSADIRAASAKLTALKRKSSDDLRKEIADAKKQKAAKEEEQKAIAEQAAAQKAEAAKRAEDDLRAAMARKQDEADRFEKSGGCPLKMVNASFFHARSDVAKAAIAIAAGTEMPIGPVTLAKCEIENCDGQPIEAYEVFVEFLDGFDDVIKDHSFKGTLLGVGENRTAYILVPIVEAAVQARIYIQRTKTSDGTIWQRQPQHKRVGKLVKKLEGADLN